MERCSLCGTPLETEATACSYCKHPVLKKRQFDEESSVTPVKSSRYVLSFIIVFISFSGRCLLFVRNI